MAQPSAEPAHLNICQLKCYPLNYKDNNLKEAKGKTERHEKPQRQQEQTTSRPCQWQCTTETVRRRTTRRRRRTRERTETGKREESQKKKEEENVFVSTGKNERRSFGEEGSSCRWVRTGEGRGGLSEGGKGGLLHSQLVELAQLLRGGRRRTAEL